MSVYQIVAVDPNDPLAVEAAKVANVILDYYERHYPKRLAETEQECVKETLRQLCPTYHY